MTRSMSKTRKGATKAGVRPDPPGVIDAGSLTRGTAAKAIWWILLGEPDRARRSLGLRDVEERAEIAEAARALADMVEEG